LEPYLASAAPETLAPRPFSPPPPASASRLAEYKRLEETPRGGAGGEAA